MEERVSYRSYMVPMAIGGAVITAAVLLILAVRHRWVWSGRGLSKPHPLCTPPQVPSEQEESGET